jgi:hypothetical protein
MSGTTTTGQLINLFFTFSGTRTTDLLNLHAYVMNDILCQVEGGQVKTNVYLN